MGLRSSLETKLYQQTVNNRAKVCTDEINFSVTDGSKISFHFQCPHRQLTSWRADIVSCCSVPSVTSEQCMFLCESARHLKFRLPGKIWRLKGRSFLRVLTIWSFAVTTSGPKRDREGLLTLNVLCYVGWSERWAVQQLLMTLQVLIWQTVTVWKLQNPQQTMQSDNKTPDRWFKCICQSYPSEEFHVHVFFNAHFINPNSVICWWQRWAKEKHFSRRHWGWGGGVTWKAHLR